MGARSDVKKYQSGCRTLENFIILPYGGVIRRPGTEFMGEARHNNTRCRLIAFNFSTTTRFVIEMGHFYMRFWSNGQRVMSGGSALEVYSPYSESQLREVQYVQINDIMYLTHPSVPVYKLSRLSDNNWTMQEVQWDWPALLEENVTATTLTCSAVTGNATLTSSAALFNGNHVGGYFMLGHNKDANSVELNINANGNSSNLTVFGAWEFSTSGIWSAEINIEQSEDNGVSWQIIRTFKGAAERNVTVSGKTDNEVLLRISVADYVTGAAWTENTNYAVDAVRVYENNVYKCVLAHNSTATAWASHNANYAVGAIVTHNTRTYKCIKAHNTTVSAYNRDTFYNAGTLFRHAATDTIYKVALADFMSVMAMPGGSWTVQANRIYLQQLGYWRGVTSGQTETFAQHRLDNNIALLSTTPSNNTANPSEDVVADYEMGKMEKMDYSPFNGEYWEPVDFTPFNAKYWTPINYSTRVARLEAVDSRVYGVVKVTGYTNPTTVSVTVINPLGATTATKTWAEGAWSNHRGHPRTVMLHEARIYYGGTSSRPLSLWASVVDDFQNMRTSELADGGMFLTLSAKEANAICWMESQDKLMIGTSGNEWTLGPLTADEGITPYNVSAVKQSAYGSKYMAAASINEVMLFVQRQGRKVRELTYVLDRDGWVAPDLTILSEHVTAGEIVEADYQQQSDAIYWAVRGDGQLIGMTYERDQEVVGWHRHTTDGLFESVAVIYGSGGSDEVWVAVNRNGSRFIERFRIDAREQYEAENKSYYWYLDSAVRRVSGASSTMSGLSHLNGRTVSLLGDGKVLTPATVSGGSVSLSQACSVVLAGLPYTSTLEPSIIDVPNMEDGHSRGRMRRIDRVMVTLQKSLGGQVSTDGNQWNHLITPTWQNLYPSKWNYLYTQDLPGDPASPNPFSGDAEIVMASDYGRNLTLKVRQVDPLPLTILALTPKMTFHGD